jgi:DNA-binding transcriptional regulator YiaG
MIEHVCKKSDLVVHAATPDKPYHFLDSGLSNVYLSGIKYWICKVCGKLSAEIPAPVQLMNVIAESVVMKRGILAGEEIKFLRKRAGKKASDFASLISTTPEHFCKLETGKLKLTEPLDKLIRLTYGMLSNDNALLARIAKNVEAWLNSIRKEKVTATIQIERTKSSDWCQLPRAA